MTHPYPTPTTEPATTVKQPYLVQLAEINRPLGQYRGKKFSEAVSTEAMGNSNFEFGAMSKSLRAFQAQFENVTIRKVETITDKDGSVLRVLSTLNDQDWEIYKQHLHSLREDKIRMEEVSRFAKDYQMGRYSNTDLWWDIQNQVMWSFDKQFMNRLTEHLQASFKHMDEQKRIAV